MKGRGQGRDLHIFRDQFVAKDLVPNKNRWSGSISSIKLVSAVRISGFWVHGKAREQRKVCKMIAKLFLFANKNGIFVPMKKAKAKNIVVVFDTRCQKHSEYL